MTNSAVRNIFNSHAKANFNNKGHSFDIKLFEEKSLGKGRQ